jgi:hypothetical protein
MLRKLAERIERNGWLMNARQGTSGTFDADGVAEKCDILSLDDNYDDFGNLKERPPAE